MMRPLQFVVGGTFLLLAVGVDAEQRDAVDLGGCGPDGYTTDIRLPGVLPICYAPAPTLHYYNGIVVPHCLEASFEETCFDYITITRADKEAYQAVHR